MRDLWPGAQLHEANPTPSVIRVHPRGKGDAKGHVAASLNEKECKAVQISAHQSLRWNQEMLWFGSYWGQRHHFVQSVFNATEGGGFL